MAWQNSWCHLAAEQSYSEHKPSKWPLSGAQKSAAWYFLWLVSLTLQNVFEIASPCTIAVLSGKSNFCLEEASKCTFFSSLWFDSSWTVSAIQEIGPGVKDQVKRHLHFSHHVMGQIQLCTQCIIEFSLHFLAFLVETVFHLKEI